MPTRGIIQHRSISGAGNTPDINTMEPHEIVINETDGKMWTKNTAGSLVEMVGSTDTTVVETTVEGEQFLARIAYRPPEEED